MTATSAPSPEPFVYRLQALVRVVDGDTLDLDSLEAVSSHRQRRLSR
jgi:hypothetical protein